MNKFTDIHISRGGSPDFKPGRHTESLGIVYSTEVERKLGPFTALGMTMSELLTLLDISQRRDNGTHMTLSGSPRRVLESVLEMRKGLPKVGAALPIEDRAKVREIGHSRFERIRSQGEVPLLHSVSPLIEQMAELALGRSVIMHCPKESATA